MKQKGQAVFILCFCIFMVLACASVEVGYNMPRKHPEEVTRNLLCTDCHETNSDTIAYERYNHTMYFADNHGHVSSLNTGVCRMCHNQSYCNDCHVSRTELKPSLKNQSANYRRMPHRGNYLVRHRIDGRINPISCFRCHGNPKSSTTCVRCHG